MRKLFWVCNTLLVVGSILHGQTGTAPGPKLIVGIVVDQMRYDQLYKYQNKYSNGGFKRLIREGFSYENTNYQYIPTLTAPGHASIYTGSVPAYHGIIGNAWFDRNARKMRENVADSTVTLVGLQDLTISGASPANLLTTTITDELRSASGFRSKVISISLKDRGAILPGGHTANAAYWFDWASSPGYFVSSTYYMEKLPAWVQNFNKLEKSNAYLNTTWNTLLPVAEYVESAADDNVYEPSIGGKSKPVFPYEFKTLREKYKSRNAEYQLMLISPDGNSLLTEFAMEAIKNETLGEDGVTDFLSMSFSVTDIVGHTFGPQSVELQDVYLRLDRNIETLLNYLDQHVGKGSYMVFLTSDHGVLPVVSYSRQQKIPAGVARIKSHNNNLSTYLNDQYGTQPWISHFQEDQIYLNRTLISQKQLDLKEFQDKVAAFMLDQNGVHTAVTAYRLHTQEFSRGTSGMLQNGFLFSRSGDVLLTYHPGIVIHANSEIELATVKGTTHGSGYAYDTHVPLVFFGWAIPHGSSVRPVAPTDISPSLAMLLKLSLPSGNVGTPLTEVIR